MKPLLRILAADDHKLFLSSISERLVASPVAQSVDTCSNYEELKMKIGRNVPDLLFLDLDLPPRNGFTICRELKFTYRDIFVAMLTSYDDEKFVNKARECGANAYFVKDTKSEVLSRFLFDLREGRITEFYAPLTKTKKNETVLKEEVDLKRMLSSRERELMWLLVQGMQRHEIQMMLEISYETFKSHRRSILRKLQVPNEMELLRFTMQNGLTADDY